MTLTHVAVEGPVRIDGENPFMCSFVMRYNRDDVVAVLIGDLGRALYRTLRMGDILKVEGQFKSGGVVYPNNRQVFVITKIELPKDAMTGRNLNLWG